MAGLTIDKSSMVKHNRRPIGRIMAIQTLSRVMIRRYDLGMAGTTIDKSGMVEYNRSPIFSNMAIRTLPWVMVPRFDPGMAGDTIDCSGYDMIKCDNIPCLVDMASRALTKIVVRRLNILMT